MARRLNNDLSPNELVDIAKNIKHKVQNMCFDELKDIAFKTLTSRVSYMDKNDLILKGWLKNVDKNIIQGDNNE
jgi:hypothetical protein